LCECSSARTILNINKATRVRITGFILAMFFGSSGCVYSTHSFHKTQMRQYWNEMNGLAYSDVKLLDITDDSIETFQGVETRKAPLIIAAADNKLFVYEIRIEKKGDESPMMKIDELCSIDHDGEARQISVLHPTYRRFQHQKKIQTSTVFTSSSNGSLQCFSVKCETDQGPRTVTISHVQTWEKLHNMSCNCLDTCLSQSSDELSVVTGGEDGTINVLYLKMEHGNNKYQTRYITEKITTDHPITGIRYQIRDGVPGIASTQRVSDNCYMRL
jgi:hypothetical protein